MDEVDPPPVPPKEAISRPTNLSPAHDLSQFDCGQSVLDAWLRERAGKNEGRYGRTYVACAGAVVVGYYSVAAGSVERSAIPSRARHGSPNPVPVSILARLAVDRRYAGQGLGSDLLADAFMRIAAAARIIGVSAILVHAKDEDALRFYRARAEFREFPEGSRTLYLPIDTILAATD